MPFVVPTMPLAINIWNFPNQTPIPPTVPPDIVTVGALRPLWTANAPASGVGTFRDTSLSLPALTNVVPRIGFTGAAASTIEAPAGSGRYYTVEYVEDVAKGFGNEYRTCLMRQVQSPIPIP